MKEEQTSELHTEYKFLLVFLAVTEIAENPLELSKDENCVLSCLRGSMTITIPFSVKTRGIQYVKDFPAPVGATVITSLPARTLRTTSICHRQGLHLKTVWTLAWTSLSF